MTAPRRVPALAVPVDARSAVTFLGYPNRSPLLAISTGRALLVTLTLPDRLEAGHVEFARQLACRAMAYAVEVERRAAGPGPAARRTAGDGMTTVKTSATVRFSASGAVEVAPSIRLSASTFIHCHVYDDCAPILAIEDGNVRLSLTVADTGHVTGQDVNRAMALADAVARYIAELGERVATEDSATDEAA